MITLQRKSDANGEIGYVHFGGVGFLLTPGGDEPGYFPAVVTLEGPSHGAPVNVYEGRAFYFDESRRFDGIRVSGLPALTTWNLYIFNDVSEGVGDGVTGGTAEGVAKTSYTQAYNAANHPTLATQGMSLQGLTGWRAIVEAAAATTLLAGTLRMWLYDTELAAWIEHPSPTWDIADFVGNRRGPILDQETTARYGRVYIEVDLGTNSGGAGAFTVYLRGTKK